MKNQHIRRIFYSFVAAIAVISFSAVHTAGAQEFDYCAEAGSDCEMCCQSEAEMYCEDECHMMCDDEYGMCMGDCAMNGNPPGCEEDCDTNSQACHENCMPDPACVDALAQDCIDSYCTFACDCTAYGACDALWGCGGDTECIASCLSDFCGEGCTTEPAGACDDTDGDCIPNEFDNCIDVPNTDQQDADGDCYGDACDSCPVVWNPANWYDVDGDLDGDACEADNDGDTFPDGTDNCPYIANDQTDTDGDGVGDACDNTLGHISVIPVKPAGAYETFGMDINDAGTVVGWFRDSCDPLLRRGFVYDGVSYTAVNCIPGNSLLWGVNDTGLAVGSDLSGLNGGFVYDIAGMSCTPIKVSDPDPNIQNTTQPFDINNAGVIVGRFGFYPSKRGFIYDGSTYAYLDVPGALQTYPSGINDLGMVAGYYEDGTTTKRYGFVFDGTTYTTIDIPGADLVSAYRINNSGQVFGYYEDAAGVPYGFMMDGATIATFDITGARDCFSWGANNTGLVAGRFGDDAENRGFYADITSVPTLIELADFSATAGSGKVIIEWETKAEIDNAGFNLYRSAGKGGDYEKINAALIPAKGSATGGATYRYRDVNLLNRTTYYYMLEDVDQRGVSTFHGPISAMPTWLFGIDVGLFGTRAGDPALSISASGLEKTADPETGLPIK